VSVFYDGLALAVMLGGLLFFLETGVNRAAIYIGMAFIFCLSVVMIFFTLVFSVVSVILQLYIKTGTVQAFAFIFTVSPVYILNIFL
ncbi:MAG: hypothetical protein GY765_23170, partial [bacterium]|nr:hypothetical protein [bacterium]